MTGAPEAGSLEVRAVSVTLGEHLAVDQVSLVLRPGAVTALVGANGAGKSTLLACLAGLRRPQAGEVRLSGRPLRALSDRRRARRIGYLPQAPEIAWPLDVETFVGLGRTPHRGAFGAARGDAAAVGGALEAVGAAAFRRRAVTTLSGGERARVLIARALAGQPEWLLADEPLAGLDLACQLDVAALLRRTAEAGCGVVVSLHDLAFAARVADRVVVLARGRVVSDGEPLRALGPAILAKAYGVEARWTGEPARPLLDVVARHAR